MDNPLQNSQRVIIFLGDGPVGSDDALERLVVPCQAGRLGSRGESHSITNFQVLLIARDCHTADTVHVLRYIVIVGGWRSAGSQPKSIEKQTIGCGSRQSPGAKVCSVIFRKSLSEFTKLASP